MDQSAEAQDNVGPSIGIATVLFFSLAILTTLVRFWARHRFLRRLLLDDYLIIASLLFFTGQSIGIWVEVANGFGQRTSNATPEMTVRMLKAGYAEHVLVFASLVCSKLSWLAFLYTMTPVAAHKRAVIGVVSFIAVYGVTAIFPGLFQCKLPAPWAVMRPPEDCINHTVWFNTLLPVDLATEVVLMALPIAVIIRLETSLGRRWTVFTIFSSRILVIITTICQWVYLLRGLASPPAEQGFDLWPSVVCAEASQAMSIFTTSLLYITPFLKSFSGGFTRFDIVQESQLDEEVAAKG